MPPLVLVFYAVPIFVVLFVLMIGSSFFGMNGCFFGNVSARWIIDNTCSEVSVKAAL